MNRSPAGGSLQRSLTDILVWCLIGDSPELQHVVDREKYTITAFLFLMHVCISRYCYETLARVLNCDQTQPQVSLATLWD